MKRTVEHPAGTFELARDETARKRLTRAAREGRAFKIFPSGYISGASLAPDDCIRLHLTAIIASIWPEGVLCGITAIQNGAVSSGPVYISASADQRRTPLKVGAFVLTPVQGPGPLPGDFQHASGLYLAGNARRLVENYHSWVGPRRT